MSNEPDFIWNALCAAQTDALLTGFDSLPSPGAAARRIRRNVERAVLPNRPRLRAARILVPVAAFLMALAFVFVCFPQAAQAVASFFGFDFRASKYMGEDPDTRSPAPSIEEAIAKAACEDVGYSVSLLNEWADAASYEACRAQLGLAPFSEEEWEYLRAVRPSVAEVLYDGNSLIWNTNLYADEKGMRAFCGGNLDALIGEITYTVEGDPTVHSLYVDAHGLLRLPDEAADHAVLYAQDSALPGEKLLPDGVITLTQTIRLAEGDAMSYGAAVALLTHTFTFDATPGNAEACGSAAFEVALSGEIDLTMNHMDPEGGALKSWTIDTQRISLEGVILDVETSYLPTGIYVRITLAQVPEGWTRDMTDGLLSMTEGDDDGAVHTPGVAGEVYVDGERVCGASFPAASYTGELAFVLPVFPQDYASIGALELRLSYTCYTQLNGADLIGGEIYEVPRGDTGIRGATKTVHLATLSIPLP